MGGKEGGEGLHVKIGIFPFLIGKGFALLVSSHYYHHSESLHLISGARRLTQAPILLSPHHIFAVVRAHLALPSLHWKVSAHPACTAHNSKYVPANINILGYNFLGYFISIPAEREKFHLKIPAEYSLL